MQKLNTLIVLFAVVALLLSAAGCTTATPTDAVGTVVAQTMQAADSETAAAPTATQEATATDVPPTATDTAAPTDTPEAGRISLAAGATQAVVIGHVDANEVKSYRASAAANQILVAYLRTPDSNAVLEIVGDDDSTLLPRANEWTSYRTLLPKTQDYEFRVVGGSSGQDFTLVLNFAVPVSFNAGDNHAEYAGQTVNGSTVIYALYANRGFELEVEVDADPSIEGLTIWGFNDAETYVSAGDGVTDFSMELPEDQYYIIEVIPLSGQVSDYVLDIWVRQ